MIGRNLILAFYFRDKRINIGKKTMEAIGMPDYVHLLLDRREKWLFVKGCEKDNDAFNVYYTTGENSDILRYYINGKALLEKLAVMIGAEKESESIRFNGRYIEEDDAVFFNLNEYTVIPYESESVGIVE